MPPTTLQLPWGKEFLSITLPERWRVQGILEPSSLPPAADPREEVLRALAHPIGASRLTDLARAGTKVAIVIDDGSRPTPVGQILPAVVAELETVGVARAEMALVPALGLHRPMTQAEIAERTGMEPGAFQTVTHHCDDPEQLRFLGTTSRGSPVWINRTVADADLVVSIGCIEPHLIASFGGGYKNIVPGVAGRATVAHNHSLNCTPGTFNMVGQPIDRNPMRLDLEEACRMLGGQVWIVNAILNHCKEIVRVVAGDPIAAHRAGVEVSARLYGVKIPRPVDVVITDSHPMDQDLRQGVKALANAIRAVRPGGVLITLVRAEEGMGVFGLANRKLPLSRGALRAVAPVLLNFVPKMKLKGMGEEDRFFLYSALQAMIRARLILYGPSIPAEKQANLPFAEFMPTIRQALQAAQAKSPEAADVLVFPYGGITYPDLGA
ncbi:MAG TPA: nickel-dependent lactate racemase [Anaerolineales bacterium]